MNDIEKINIYLDKTICNCEKMKEKFKEGSSQYSLLTNRIKALEIGKASINGKCSYSKDELEKAMAPILSIIHKLTAAQSKYEYGSTQYKRFQGMIKNIETTKEYIEKCITEYSENN